MNKKLIAISALVVLLIVGVVAAHGFREQSTTGANEDMQNTMEPIIETGTYTDLVNYRTTSGYNVMPWVKDEESFKALQELHNTMDQYAEENGLEMGPQMMGQGFSMGSGFRRARGFDSHENSQSRFGCPMFDGDGD